MRYARGGMRAADRLVELLDALRAAGLYRSAEGRTDFGGSQSSVLDTRSNDYLGLACEVFGRGLGDAGRAQEQSARGGDVSRETAGATVDQEPRDGSLGEAHCEWRQVGQGSAAREPTRGLVPRVSRETRGHVAGAERLGAGASRLVSGTTLEHEALEAALATWLEVESSLLFSSAYAANVGVLSALALPSDVIFSDALNHASIIDGCRLSRAETVVVPHRDLDALAVGLARPRPERTVRWVVTESYFSMDGTSPDFAALRELCNQHQAALILDETHGLGVFGPEGRGLAAAVGVVPDLLVGGFGKAFGLQGGFVAGARCYRQWLWNRARSFVFSTGVSPWLCARAQEHLQVVRTADRARTRLGALAARLERKLISSGIPLPAGRHGPLFPVVFGSEAATLRAAAQLEQLGVRAQAIRPPTVPRGSSRLRISLRADMTDTELELLGSALLSAWREQSADPADSSERSGAAGTLPGAAPPLAAPPLAAPSLASAVSASPSSIPQPGLAPSFASPPAASPPDVASPSGVRAQPDLASSASAASPSVVPPPSTSAPAQLALGARTRTVHDSFTQQRWIVLGTGTGVGKSYVAAALVRILAESGHAVAGLKPVETGCGTSADGQPCGGDAALLEQASARVKHPRPHPLYAFREPIAPSLAAHHEGQEIDVNAIASWVDRVRCQSSELPALVIETAGGVLSPLGAGTTNFELARALGNARWVLVAPDRLGVLHDVTSTLHALRALGRSPDVLVLSAPPTPDASTGSNAAELRRLGLAVPVVELRRNEPGVLAALLAE